MIRALYSAGSGMNAQQMSIDNIANNLANANTTGFKARRDAVSGPAVSELPAAGRGGGLADHRAQRVAAGPGHAARGQHHRLYAGQLSGDRQSAGSGDPGQRILPDHAGRTAPSPIRAPAASSSTRTATSWTGNGESAAAADRNSRAGAVDHHRAATARSATRCPGQTAAQVAGQIQLANFANPGGLNSIGSSLFLPTDASGDPTVGIPGGQEGLGTLQQGYIEVPTSAWWRSSST